MKWYNRFFIVASYFFFISLIWILVFSYFTFNSNKWDFIWKVASLTLPLGYFISVFSQLLYYLGYFGNTIHKETVRKIFSDRGKEFANGLGLDEDDDEATCESKLTAILRLGKLKGSDGKNLNLKNLKYLGTFATSRFDVLSVNNSLIVATPIAMLIISIATFVFKMFEPSINMCLFAFVFVILVISIVVLIKSNKILNSQIADIHLELFKLKKREKRQKIQVIENYKSILFIMAIILLIFLFDILLNINYILGKVTCF